MEKELEQHIVLGVKILPIILGHKKKLNDKQSTQRKISPCCLSIKQVEVFKEKTQQQKIIQRFTD